MNHSIQKVRKCSDFISSFPLSISFCVTQQNTDKRPQEVLGFTSCLLLKLIIRGFSHTSGISHTPKNEICWARALQKSVFSKLPSSEAPWNCCQPPKPTLSIVFKDFLIKYLPENGLMCVSSIHRHLYKWHLIQEISHSWHSVCNNAQNQVSEEAQPQRECWAVGRKDSIDNYL